MTDTFTPPMNPSADGTAEEVMPDVDEVAFGDGYSQRTPKGLHANERETHSLSWAVLDQTMADEIDAFLRPKLGWEAFYWTPPGQLGAKKYIAKGFRRRPLGAGLYAIGVTFERVFDL
jgi:phage-related protein